MMLPSVGSLGALRSEGSGDWNPITASLHALHLTRPSQHQHTEPDGPPYPTDPSQYQLIEEVGCGVTAKVWTATCTPLGTHVAIKIVDLERLGDKMDIVVQESRLMFSLRSPNVLPLLAAFLVKDCLWMVAPYASGGSLESVMHYSHPKGFDEATVATIGKEIATGLEYLHRHDVMHRDLKAANVLVTEAGGILLADFGVAASLEASGSTPGEGRRLCRRTTFVGSPAWMAPEVLEQADGYSFPSDIYSFGMVLLELILGKVPYAGMPFQVVVMTKLRGKANGLDRLASERHVSQDMQDLAAACLQRDPAARPTAVQVLKHRWFTKHASKHPHALVQGLLSSIPPLEERLGQVKEGSERGSGDDSEDSDGVVAYTEAGHHARLSVLREREAQEATQGFTPDLAALVLKRFLLPMVGRSNSFFRALPLAVAINGTEPDTSHRPEPVLSTKIVQDCAGIAFVCHKRKVFSVNQDWQRGFIMPRVPFDDDYIWAGPCYFYRYSPGSILALGKPRRSISLMVLGNDFTRRSLVEDLQDGDILDVGLQGEAHAFCKAHSAEAQMAEFADKDSRCFVWLQPESEMDDIELDHWVADNDSNELLYGKPVSAADILAGKVAPPENFKALIDDLTTIGGSGGEGTPRAPPRGLGSFRSGHISSALRSLDSFN